MTSVKFLDNFRLGTIKKIVLCYHIFNSAAIQAEEDDIQKGENKDE